MSELISILVVFFAVIITFSLFTRAFFEISKSIGEINSSSNLINFSLSLISTFNKFPPENYSFFKSTWNKYKNTATYFYSNNTKSIKFYILASSRVIAEYKNFSEVTEGNVLYYIGKDCYIDFDGKNFIFILDGKPIYTNPKGW